MPDLDAGAPKESKQTFGAPYPSEQATGDGPEREAHPVPTREELEVLDEPTTDEGEQP